MRLVRNPYMVPAVAQLRRPNPFMVPAVAQLRRPNPKRAQNPLLRMPRGCLTGALLGSALAVVTDKAVDNLFFIARKSRWAPVLTHVGLGFGAACFRSSPVLAGFAGANLYAAMMHP